MIGISQLAYSQDNHVKSSSRLGIHYIVQNFSNNDLLGKPRSMDAGLSINHLFGITSKLDLNTQLSGCFPDSISNHFISSSKRQLLLQLSSSLRYNIIHSSSIRPFFEAGTGLFNYNRKAGAFVLAGGGVSINYKDVYIIGSMQRQFALSKYLNNHFVYSLGIAGVIGHRKHKMKNEKAQTQSTSTFVVDSDGDGILNPSDSCPTIPGFAKFNGCPDTDLDGIQDKEDQCPTQFGFIRYKGCPIPDRDKDGINDEEDVCIDIPGIKEFKGCPPPDTDGDGIADHQDRCPNNSGPRENGGCPLIDQKDKKKLDLAAQSIHFKTGSAEILNESFKALKEVIQILENNPAIKLHIEGHTDNVGNERMNKKLSEQRAKAVMNYLNDNGIAKNRLSYKGFGSLNPVTNNNNTQSRAKNRRVEFVF